MIKRKLAGYWQDINNGLRDARQAMREQGWDVLPSEGTLRRTGHAGLAGAIRDCYGGFITFREKLGQDELVNPKGFWKDIENGSREAREAMEKEGWDTLPNGKRLGKAGYNGLVNAINKYYGGFPAFREKLGQDELKKSDGFWQDVKNGLKQARRAMVEQGWDMLPSYGRLSKAGYSMLAKAIIIHYGGFITFREKLGRESERKPNGYWPNMENGLREAQNAVENEGWDALPGSPKLKKKGYGGLVKAIKKYYGGFPSFREKLRTHMNQPAEKDQLESLLESYVNGGNQDE